MTTDSGTVMSLSFCVCERGEEEEVDTLGRGSEVCSSLLVLSSNEGQSICVECVVLLSRSSSALRAFCLMKMKY